MALFLLSAALAVDVIEFLLDLIVIGAIVNRFISVFAFLFFLTWFYLLGVKFTKNPSNVNSFIIGFIIKLIPFLDLLPAWTVLTVRMIYLTRKEDKLAVSGKAAGKMAPKNQNKETEMAEEKA